MDANDRIYKMRFAHKIAEIKLLTIAPIMKQEETQFAPVNFMNISRLPVFYHILFWTVYFSFNFLRWGSFYEDYWFSLKSNLIEFPLHIILVYFNIFYLMPRLIPRKLGWYVFFLGISTLIISFIKLWMTYLFVTTEIYIEFGQIDSNLLAFNYVLSAFIGEIYVVGITTAIQITFDWVQTKTKTKELERLNLETELDFLKSQIQPHFFFNTLNNLYSLTLSKSKRAPETVLKLSDLMSYVIYDANQKRVPLVNEIKHIQNYLDLEKLRYGDRLQIDFNVEGAIEGKKIPPVLLLPFIENSFKHGTKVSDPVIPISIKVKVEENHLIFSTKNRKADFDMMDNGLETYKHGVGLQNTIRRLKLVFGDQYKLDIEDSEKEYEIKLKIPINED